MITRNREVMNPFEKEIILICYHEEVYHQFIPSLQKLSELSIVSADNFIEYIHLLEKLIKSAAILQTLLSSQENCHIILANKEIKTTQFTSVFDEQFKKFIVVYLQNQGNLSELLASSESLFKPTIEIKTLEEFLKKAKHSVDFLKT